MDAGGAVKQSGNTMRNVRRVTTKLNLGIVGIKKEIYIVSMNKMTKEEHENREVYKTQDGSLGHPTVDTC